MYKLGPASHKNMVGLHPSLIGVIHAAMGMQIMDFSVIEGVRGEERQKLLFNGGTTLTMRSKHLIQPDSFGHAFDAQPYPLDMKRVINNDMKEIARFGVLSGIIKACASIEGVTIVNGMDWDNDGEILDHKFFDAWHFELRI